jgi:hypothetical protein
VGGDQTRAIHAQQRTRETLDGLLAKSRRDRLTALHRNAQRLLEPLAVVNPYADQLRFQDHQTRSRRDQVKYLTLIRAIALLHQFQREVKTLQEGGRMVRYIEVEPKDIELANRLAQEVLGRTVDELLPQTRKLLVLLHDWIETECRRNGVPQADFRFSRRQVREALGWGDTQLKVHLGRLTELEYLVAHSGRQGRSFAYELLYQGEDAEGRAKLLMVREGKGKKDRIVPIGDRALAWIAAYRDRARPELLGDNLDSGALFLNNLGNPLRPFHLTMLTKGYIDKANIGKEGSCHIFRHSCATVLLEGGMDTRHIQEILGHASLESTQIYTRVSIQRLKALHTAIHPGRMPEIGKH